MNMTEKNMAKKKNTLIATIEKSGMKKGSPAISTCFSPTASTR